MIACNSRVYAQNKLGQGYEFGGNGKDSDATNQNEIYEQWVLPPGFAEALRNSNMNTIEALQIVNDYLSNKQRLHRYEKLSFNDRSLEKTVSILIELIENKTENANLKFYRIAGEDFKGNVHFTGYFTPILEARKERDQKFKYPIYRYPDNWEQVRPTREMIDDHGVLADLGLEIAWTSNLLGNYFMQVQGSGFLKYEDGSVTLLTFEGQNGYAYSSLGNYMVTKGYIEPSAISLASIKEWFNNNPDSLSSILNRNKSYAFFTESSNVPRGSSGTILVPGHSIAVDPLFIPHGAVLLAKIPVLDWQGKFSTHIYQFLSAQDSGGAIKGPGHIDLYFGVGEKGLKKAGPLHHYGTLWLILPGVE